jgi:hypothetical protein
MYEHIAFRDENYMRLAIEVKTLRADNAALRTANVRLPEPVLALPVRTVP